MVPSLKSRKIVVDVITISAYADKRVHKVAEETGGMAYHLSESVHNDIFEIFDEIGDSGKNVLQVHISFTSGYRDI